MKVRANGLGFPEGPVALPDGRIAFVDLRHQKVRIFDGGETVTLAVVEGSPNGMCLGPDGSLLVANNGGLAPLSLEELWAPEKPITGRIQRVTLDGQVSDVAVDLPGPPPWRPNDLVLAPDGRVIFTDPDGWEAHDWEAVASEEPPLEGRICAATLDGIVELLAVVPAFPNGLLFAPDGALLVAQTLTHRILRFPWINGSLGESQIWAELPEHIGPDGLHWHEDRLYVAGSVGDEVLVLGESGKLEKTIQTGKGSDPTNLCVAHGLLWVTLGLPGQLVTIDLV